MLRDFSDFSFRSKTDGFLCLFRIFGGNGFDAFVKSHHNQRFLSNGGHHKKAKFQKVEHDQYQKRREETI